MYNILRLCSADSGTNNINWEIVWSTVFTGIAVVFLILAILIIFFIIMGKIFQTIDKKSSEKATKKLQDAVSKIQPTTRVEPPPVIEPVQEDEDDEEIIAVISAAIAAYSAADGKQYRIVGVKRRDRASRSGWSAAGVSENTRGFIN